MPKKPTLAIYSFTCCEGCQVMFFQFEEQLLNLFKIVDLTKSRLLGVKAKIPKSDIALVEGSIIGKEAMQELKEIRKKSTYLVSLGSCAVTGGIPAIRNSLPAATKKHLEKLSPNPKGVHNVSDIVKVDFQIRGCPSSEQELLNVLLKLANGIEPQQIQSPVCAECKMRETYCLLIKGEPCLGPVAIAGCNAPCPSEGYYCNACRGIYEDENMDSLKKLLKAQGNTKKEIDAMLNIYNAETKSRVNEKK